MQRQICCTLDQRSPKKFASPVAAVTRPGLGWSAGGKLHARCRDATEHCGAFICGLIRSGVPVERLRPTPCAFRLNWSCSAGPGWGAGGSPKLPRGKKVVPADYGPCHEYCRRSFIVTSGDAGNAAAAHRGNLRLSRDFSQMLCLLTGRRRWPRDGGVSLWLWAESARFPRGGSTWIGP